ncbi:hypothetical protein [Vibrio cholerae]|uniref:hypothetical protein n=1 Tax=Vibrio cholerae TaxID=666 RepID=UPI00301789A5
MQQELTIDKFTRCKTCQRYITEKTQKKIGDKVEFMDVKTTLRGKTCSSKQGKILEIRENSVVVKRAGRGGIVCISKNQVRDPEGSSSVSVMMFGECSCGKN